MNTTSTAALSAAGAAGTLSIANANIIAGYNASLVYGAIGSLPVYCAAADGTKAGAFLTATPDFVGSWTLTRRTSGIQGDTPIQQIVLRGDATLLMFCGAGPLISLTACDALTLTVTNCRLGSVTLTLVQ